MHDDMMSIYLDALVYAQTYFIIQIKCAGNNGMVYIVVCVMYGLETESLKAVDTIFVGNPHLHNSCTGVLILAVRDDVKFDYL
jgi:hypothetical protein